MGQDIPREQVGKIIANKKSDLLTGFVSQRTRRKFSAYLVLGDEGKTTFEFPEREAKSGAPKGKSGFRRFGKPNLSNAAVAATLETNGNGVAKASDGEAEAKTAKKKAPARKSKPKK